MFVRSVVALAATCGLLLVQPAAAQSSSTSTTSVKCVDGKTPTGSCANSVIVSIVRQTTIALTQPKLSYTGAPVSKSVNPGAQTAAGDRGRELKYETSNPAGPQAPSGTFIAIPPSINPATLQITAPYTVVSGGIMLK